jgi:hypothetical protein
LFGEENGQTWETMKIRPDKIEEARYAEPVSWRGKREMEKRNECFGVRWGIKRRNECKENPDREGTDSKKRTDKEERLRYSARK